MNINKYKIVATDVEKPNTAKAILKWSPTALATILPSLNYAWAHGFNEFIHLLDYAAAPTMISAFGAGLLTWLCSYANNMFAGPVQLAEPSIEPLAYADQGTPLCALLQFKYANSFALLSPPDLEGIIADTQVTLDKMNHSQADYKTREMFAYGDTHADLVSFKQSLRASKTIDDQDNWIGGNRIVFTPGDFIDRGSDDFEIYEFLGNLRQQAEEAGGKLILLLGNHEHMLINGNYQEITSHTELLGFEDRSSLEQSVRQMAVNIATTIRTAKGPFKEIETSVQNLLERLDENDCAQNIKKEIRDFATNLLKYRKLAEDIKLDIINGNIQMAYKFGPMVFSHAGITTPMNELLAAETAEAYNKQTVTNEDLVRYVNELLIISIRTDNFDHPIFNVSKSRLDPRMANPNKYSPDISGLLWTDANRDLLNQAPDYPQGFGHTVMARDIKRQPFHRKNLLPLDLGSGSHYRTSKSKGRRGWLEVSGRENSITQKIEHDHDHLRLAQTTPEYWNTSVLGALDRVSIQ